MRKLVFVSFAIFGGIFAGAYGMFNDQDELQNANNRKLLKHEKFSENEREEGHQSEVYNYQIGDLREQVSRLTTLVETSLANEERKNKEKDQSEVYNYQIGDLKAQISGLTTLVETLLANEKRKDEEQKQSEVYNYQIGNLGARLSSLRTLVQDLSEKVMILSEEKESLIVGNVVKSQESTEQKEEAKSADELEQQDLVQTKESEINQQELDHEEGSNADKLEKNKEKTSSDASAASAAADVNTVTVTTAKSAIEEMLTELLNVAGESVVKQNINKFYEIVNPSKRDSSQKWLKSWVNSPKLIIENDKVRFQDPASGAYHRGFSRIKEFLENVQKEIEQYKGQRNNGSKSSNLD